MLEKLWPWSARQEPEQVIEESRVGVVTRSSTKPKRIDSTGREYTLSDSTTPTSEEALTTSEVIFSCVDFIASSASQVRFNAFTRDPKRPNVKKPLSNKALTKALMTNPSPTATWSEVLTMATTQILLDGEAFIAVETVGSQFEFTNIDSDTSVEILFDQEHPEIPTGYQIGASTYTLEEMIHIKRIGISGDLHGQSVLESLVDPLVLDGYAHNDLKSLYENGSVPETFLSGDTPLAPRQVEQIEKSLRLKYTGDGRHKTMVLPNGLKPTALKISPKDAALIDSMHISEDRILRAFKLHKAILGGSIDSYTHDIQGLATIQFNHAVRPLLNLIRDKMEMTLRKKLKRDDIIIEMDYTNVPEISRALTVHTETARAIYGSGLGTLNEARELIGLPPLQDPLADENFLPEHLLGSTLTSIQALDEADLEIIRKTKVAEAQSAINNANSGTTAKPKGSDDPQGGTPNGVKE